MDLSGSGTISRAELDMYLERSSAAVKPFAESMYNACAVQNKGRGDNGQGQVLDFNGFLHSLYPAATAKEISEVTRDAACRMLNRRRRRRRAGCGSRPGSSSICTTPRTTGLSPASSSKTACCGFAYRRRRGQRMSRNCSKPGRIRISSNSKTSSHGMQEWTVSHPVDGMGLWLPWSTCMPTGSRRCVAYVCT